ncbi:MAG TPA: zinc ribbon domain-containing protein [Candidatus Ornithoclostridium faecavium]|nr:zinc ribbon domain-containing protein [Candidatus Ornithoclostridium faecavium]
MVCKKCGTEFDGAFCPKCGERADEKMIVCPVCGKDRAEGENFCSKCGYAFERQAQAEQNTQTKFTFDKEILLGGVRKFYRTSLNIGKVFFSLLLFLILASPIMLHYGINTAGSGYINAFNLYVDGRFTAVCAILMIIAFYSLVYGVYACVKFFVFRNKAESKASKFIYFAFSLAVFIVCCIGCSGAGEWFADAGAGLSFGIFVGLVGMALSVLRYFFENRFFENEKSEQETEVEDKIKEKGEKVKKFVGEGTILITVVLVITILVTLVVQTIYTNPFGPDLLYGWPETRADVIKRFGIPLNAKENDLSYTYYSTEYIAAERMINKLVEAQDKELTDGFESDADSFVEDDFESMFDGIAGIDAIILKLREKQQNSIYKKTIVTFNDDGENKDEDTVKSYVCEVISPVVDGEEKKKRELKMFVYDGTIDDKTNIAKVTYFAKYDDGSFIGNSIEFVVDGVYYKFNDVFGEHTITIEKLQNNSTNARR